MATVTDASDVDFADRVIERSRSVPVVVDFWAPWCGPCRSLGPVLERLADEAAGRWELVKVNVDNSPGLAVRYGIQGIPAVKAFVEGNEVAQFVGAQPRPHVEEWLSTFLPDPSRDLVSAGEAAERGGARGAAREFYEKALKINPHSEAARQGLDRIILLEDSAEADPADLEARFAADPGSVQTALDLAKVKLARDDTDFYEPLLQVIGSATDPGARKAAQSAFLELIGLVPAGDPRAAEARRRLASVLYR